MNAEADEIFVSIAAYRDLQLGPTIHDLIAKAVHPERVRVGVCWQKDADEPALPIAPGDARFRLLEVDWRDSRGACWARAEAMKLWQGEPWYLQIDSHCRFLHGWDRRLIDMAAQTGAPKPLLSTYAPAFTPAKHEILAGDPLQMIFQAFTPDGLVQLNSTLFPPGVDRTQPVPARFLAAGLLFAPGSFVEEVPYDPELYFMGEECAMTVRAWTSGYDLYAPWYNIVWHDYKRHNSRRHWNDHTDDAAQQNPRTRPWGELDLYSRAKVQKLLLGEPVAPFGLGSARTLAEYEAYAGLSFAKRKAQAYTVRGLLPPNPEPLPDWAERILPWITRIRLERDRLPPGAFEDPAMWCVAVRDKDNNELVRIDMMPADLAAFEEGTGEIVFTCEFPSDAVPARWSLLPQSRTRGWLQRVEGELGEDDFAVIDENGDEE